MGEAQVALTEVIQRAEQDQRDLAEEKRRAAKARMDLEHTRTEYERLLADLKQQRKEMLGESREEARRIVARCQAAHGGTAQLAAPVRAGGPGSEAGHRDGKPRSPPSTPRPPPAEVVCTVQTELASISDEAKAATAESRRAGTRARAAASASPGQRTQGRRRRLRPLRETARRRPRRPGRARKRASPSRHPSPQRPPRRSSSRAPDNLITVTRYVPQRPRPPRPCPPNCTSAECRVEPALYELEKYLDQAVVAGHPRVRIVHGKGTGLMRQAVHERLRQSRLVKSFRLGESGEGDTGVTVVELGEA